MLQAASHLVVGSIGIVLLYVALFLRETEQGKLQNRLEKLWVDVDDLSKQLLSKQIVFLQQISIMADSALSRIFGNRLFSAGAVATSTSFSVGSILLFLYFWSRLESEEPGVPHDNASTFLLVVGILCFVIGLLPIVRYLGFLWFFFGFFAAALESNSQLVWEWGLWLGGSFLSDALFIAMSRLCLRKSSKLSGLKTAILLAVNGCFGLVLISPIIWAILLRTEHQTLEVGTARDLMLLTSSNLAAGAISLLFILLALVALAHLAVWPILERPIYSLQRFGVARNPKLLAAASVICLMFAWPRSPIIQAITKLVHG